jgi:protein TonB
MKPLDQGAALPATTQESFSCSLIRRAARRAPDELAARLEEEWLADLSAHRGKLSRLRFAIGCCWATRVIAHDYLAGAVTGAATAAAAGDKTLALGAQNHSPFSQRGTIFVLIAGLHVVLIYGFASGFGAKIVKSMSHPTIGILIDYPKPKDPPPAPVIKRTSVRRTVVDSLPTPPVLLDKPPVITLPDDPQDRVVDLPPDPPEPPLVKRVQGGPGSGFPTTDDYYPSSSRRLGENGVATIQVCVNESGRLTSAPTVAQSSGSARLDDGAIRLAQAGSGHYRTTTEDGRPVSDCYAFRIRFELKR